MSAEFELTTASVAPMAESAMLRPPDAEPVMPASTFTASASETSGLPGAMPSMPSRMNTNPASEAIIPTAEELNLEGVDITPEDLETILTIDNARWQQEMGYREEHLKQFDNLPEEIWEAHRRVTAALEQDG